jgi:hypothetical protein
MAQTMVRGTQVLDHTIQRDDLDTTTVGNAVAAKIIQGTGINLSSTGADAGTGDVTVSSPVSTNTGNLLSTGSDNLHYLPASQLDPEIWSTRLRSFNAIGNPTFEVDQRNAGGSLTNPTNVYLVDRWQLVRTASTGAANYSSLAGVLIPGTNFAITSKGIGLQLTTAQSTLAAGDYYTISTVIEGPNFRELSNDVHSCSLLVQSNVAGLKFGLSLRDPTGAHSLVKLCTIANASTWTLITLPNLPVWPSGTFSTAVGSQGYLLTICLAAGSTNISSANDAWQSGNFVGAVGQSNWLGQAVNSTFYSAMVQHEPGSVCSQLMDIPFTGPNGNLEACMRYFQSTYDYGIRPGTANNQPGSIISPYTPTVATNGIYIPVRFPKVMAKDPTVNIYSPITGAIGNVRNGSTGADASVASVINPGTTGYGGVGLSANAGTVQYMIWHHTADTGW